ncbi:hypothetical protein K9N50_12695 [bacterium]|nr:hypothetical protein [bacterium]
MIATWISVHKTNQLRFSKTGKVKINMKSKIFAVLLIATFSLIVIGCGYSDSKLLTETLSLTPTVKSTAVPTNTLVPTDTPSPTNTVTPTFTSTVTPTPIGGSVSPILAMSISDNYQPYILVTELYSEKEIARITINEPGKTLSLSPDGEYLAYIDDRGDEQGIFLYNLLSQETTHLFTSPDETEITKIRWSPDQRWLGFEMQVFARRRTELWIVEVSNGTSRYISSGYDIEWLSAGKVYYQDSGGTNRSLNLLTGKSEPLQYYHPSFSTLERLLGEDLSNMTLNYLPELGTSLVEGTNLRDQENPHHFIIRRDTDDPPGLHLASYKTETDLYMWDLLLSPDEKFWMICFTEGEGVRGFGTDGLNSGHFFTSWATQDELPITRETFTVENFQPLLWAPDGDSILGLHHNPEGRGNVDRVEILDISSGDLLYSYKFSRLDHLYPSLYLSDGKPRNFDLIWNESQVDLTGVEYIPTPTATIDPNIPPDQPLMDYLQEAKIVKFIDIASFKQHKQQWDFNNAKFQNENIIIKGSGAWGDAYLDYHPSFDIIENTGILVKFKASQDALGIIALNRGEHETPSYRQWGVVAGSASTSPIISKGTDHSGRPEMVNTMGTVPDIWYYLFLGLDENNDLIQLIWNAQTTPSDFHLAFYNFEDVDDSPYYFHLACKEGEIFIGETVLYQFSGYTK